MKTGFGDMVRLVQETSDCRTVTPFGQLSLKTEGGPQGVVRYGGIRSWGHQVPRVQPRCGDMQEGGACLSDARLSGCEARLSEPWSSMGLGGPPRNVGGVLLAQEAEPAMA